MQLPDVEEHPGMFLHADQLRARLILRHLLKAWEPRGPTAPQTSSDEMGFTGGGFRNAQVSCQ